MKKESTQMIDISKLEKSPLNVRKTVIGVDDLKASIQAHGLMQNLVVTPAPKGGYYVVAGSRRLEAIKQLIKEKKSDLTEVPCQVIAENESAEVSLAENTIRQAMHPADEFEAYNALNKKGDSSAKIAERFGVTEKHVLQRLKMSQVNAEIIKEYKSGKITLDVVMAFTLCADPVEQLKIFKKLTKWDKDDGERVKRVITNKLSDTDDKFVKFVGLEKYKEAGGKVRADLFGEEIYIEDLQLLSKLVEQKLENTKQMMLNEGWMWCETAIEDDYSFTHKLGRIDSNSGKYKKDDMKKAGVYVSIGYHGTLDVKKGLVRQSEKKLFKKDKDKGGEIEQKRDMTESLKYELREVRRQLMQVVMIRNPELAFDMTVYRLALKAYEKAWNAGGLDINLPDTSSDGYHTEYEAFTKTLNIAWLKISDEIKQYQAFEQLTKKEKMDILAWASARGINGNLYNDFDSIEYCITKTGIDAATLWRPTDDNYFNKITKDQMLEIAKEIFGKDVSDTKLGFKKSEIALSMNKYFAGTIKVEDKSVKERLKNWMPKGLSFAEMPKTKVKK